MRFPELVFAHVLAGILSASYSASQPAPSSAFLIALVLSQASLLGMWAGLGPAHWLWRLLGAAASSLYLGVELGLGISELEFYIFFLVALATSVVAAVCLGVRRFRGVMTRDLPAGGALQEGLQFTIWHLMLLTFVVACLINVGQSLAPLVQGVGLIARIAVLGLCYAAVSLTAMWAMMGSGRPAARSFPLFLVAVGAGLGGGYIIGDVYLVFWTSTTVLQAVILAGSLWVVRRAGYRLVAKSRSAMESPQAT